MVIEPKTAKSFHEVLLSTTMKWVQLYRNLLKCLTISQSNNIFLDLYRYRRHDKQVNTEIVKLLTLANRFHFLDSVRILN